MMLVLEFHSLYFMLLHTSNSSIHINTKRQTNDRTDERS